MLSKSKILCSFWTSIIYTVPIASDIKQKPQKPLFNGNVNVNDNFFISHAESADF